MLAIQNYSLVPNKVSFKAKQTTENNNSAFETHAGLKTGVVYSGIGLLSNIFTASILSSIKNVGKNNPSMFHAWQEDIGALEDENIRIAKSMSKKNWVYLAIVTPIALGCGALIDYCANKKYAKLADNLAKNDKKKIIDTDEDVAVSPKGHPYYKSNFGKKIGPCLGAVLTPVLLLTYRSIQKLKFPLPIITGAITGAIGGLILGSITDACSNKSAKNFANKEAVKETLT